jgi:hypothetical protein
MKAKYWLCKRKEIFFSFDSATGKRESLHTADREAAKQIIRAKNDAATQPAIKISIAKAYVRTKIKSSPSMPFAAWTKPSVFPTTSSPALCRRNSRARCRASHNWKKNFRRPSPPKQRGVRDE